LRSSSDVRVSTGTEAVQKVVNSSGSTSLFALFVSRAQAALGSYKIEMAYSTLRIHDAFLNIHGIVGCF
jgi:hypothetical protein